jgi:DNA-binding response OmpR family regulator
VKILLIEDDVQTAQFITQALTDDNYEVTSAFDGGTGWELAKAGGFDLAIVDIMLPVMDGLDILKNMREKGDTTPVIILSARTSVEDKVRGLQSGADVYLPKPFTFAELLANVQAQLRRTAMANDPTHLTAGPLVMDLVTRKVTRDGVLIDLPPREFSLLEYLMRNAGKVVTREMIMTNVWNYNFDLDSNIVETRIYKLREKLDKPFDQELLQTVRGVGYVLDK